jgi:GTPase SAR1 family protein
MKDKNRRRVFLVVFSLVDSRSLGTALDYWSKEVAEHFSNECPWILVGTKLDERRKGNFDGI